MLETKVAVRAIEGCHTAKVFYVDAWTRAQVVGSGEAMEGFRCT